MNQDRTPCEHEVLVAALKSTLETALIIIAGEYPKDDDNYKFAVRNAERFNLDIGEDER